MEPLGFFEVQKITKNHKKVENTPKTPKIRHFLKTLKKGLKMAKNSQKNVSKSVLNFDPYFQKMNTFLGDPGKWLTFEKQPFLGYGVIWEI